MDLGSFMDLGAFDDTGLFYEGQKVDEWPILDSPTNAFASFLAPVGKTSTLLAKRDMPAIIPTITPTVAAPFAAVQLAPVQAPKRTAAQQKKKQAQQQQQQQQEVEEEQAEEDDDMFSLADTLADESGRPNKQRRLNKNPKNKLAADKYRRKKKEEMIDLQESVKVMQRERTELDVRHNQLMQELEFLRNVIKSSPHLQQAAAAGAPGTPTAASASPSTASCASTSASCTCGCHSEVDARLSRMEDSLATIAAALAARK